MAHYATYIIGYNGTRLTYNCAHLRSTKESLTFEYLDILFLYHVSIGCHWLIHDSLRCTGWFLVRLTWYCSVLIGTGLLNGFYARMLP